MCGKKDYEPAEEKYPSVYREVKIGRTLYCVTSVFTGEKELGEELEKLAVRRILEDMDKNLEETGQNDGRN